MIRAVRCGMIRRGPAGKGECRNEDGGFIRATGHGFDALTGSEARYLTRFKRLTPSGIESLRKDAAEAQAQIRAMLKGWSTATAGEWPRKPATMTREARTADGAK